MRSSGHTSLLGISLGSGRMTAVWMRRAGSRVQVRKALRTSLSLDPVRNDPDLVGREIRGHLSEAGIRESRCVVCLPLKWALTVRTDLPELSEEDTAAYLHIEAERGFPFAPEDLQMSVSRYRTPGGDRQATIVAVPSNRLTALLRALKAAKLRPVSITLGVTSLVESGKSSRQEAVTLLVGENGVDLAVSAGSGVAALRSLDEAVEAGPGGNNIDADATARQIRITLGQLPEGLRDTIRTVRVFGPADMAEPLCTELGDAAGRMALSVELGNGSAGVQMSEADIRTGPSPSILSATTDRMLGRPSELEFLPPRTSRLKQLTGGVSSGATRVFAGAAILSVLVVAASFFYQGWRLSRLESEWSLIEPKYNEVAALQGKVRQFRGWFGDTAHSLVIARSLTQAFPEEGDVWAEMVEIKQLPEAGWVKITCTGKARRNSDFLAMRERLEKAEGIRSLHVQQVKGEDPLQFTIDFAWNVGGPDGR